MNIGKVPFSILALPTLLIKRQRMDVVLKPKHWSGKARKGKMSVMQSRFKPIIRYTLSLSIIHMQMTFKTKMNLSTGMKLLLSCVTATGRSKYCEKNYIAKSDSFPKPTYLTLFTSKRLERKLCSGEDCGIYWKGRTKKVWTSLMQYTLVKHFSCTTGNECFCKITIITT